MMPGVKLAIVLKMKTLGVSADGPRSYGISQAHLVDILTYNKRDVLRGLAELRNHTPAIVEKVNSGKYRLTSFRAANRFERQQYPSNWWVDGDNDPNGEG